MPKKPKFELDTVKDITVGSEATSRKVHNQGKRGSIKGQLPGADKQRPGEIYSAQTPVEGLDRLERENLKAAQREQQRVNTAYEGKPRPGEILSATDPEKEKADTDKLRAFLRLAGERFRLSAEAEGETRKEALDDLKFLAGEQWTYDIKNSRELDGRPCLTMNHLPQFVRQVTNEQRQQRPSIQVNPIGDQSDKETAEIYQGMIRHIEVNSDAEIAYDTAFEHCVATGFGYWRIVKDYVDDGSDEQELKIKRIRNPFNVYFDPASVEPCYEDARFAFVIEDIPRSEYRVLYPNSDESSLTEFSSVGDNMADWVTRDTIRVAEYWYVEETVKTMARLNSGEMVEKTKDLDPLAIQNERKVVHREVKCSVINAAERLEDYDWEGRWIPIVPVLGDDYDIDGKRHLAGLIRNSKDPMRMYNYWISAATEMIALAPRAPFVGVEGQFEGHEDQWKQANARNFPYLEYKDIDVAGKQAGPPQRQTYEPPVQAINMMVRQADNDIKATIGIYDASLGQKGPDQSGKAILARQKQSEVSTMNFSDNLARSIRHTGRLLIDLGPKIYDTPRIQRIINPDGSVNQVGIYNSQNIPQGVNPETLLMAKGVKKIYDIGVGRYDVSVSVGPSYQSKRQESVVSMLEFMKAYPQSAPLIGDLVAGNSDWPGAKQIQERLKKMLPPQLQEGDEQDPEVQLNQTRQQLHQAMQQHDLMMKSMNDMAEVLKSKQIENDAKLKIAEMDNQTKLAVAEITTKAQDAKMRREFEFEEFKLLHMASHDVGLEAMGHQHALEQGQQGHDQALEQGEQEHGQALEQQDQVSQAAMAQQKAAASQQGAAQ